MNSLSNLITLQQAENFLNSIANFGGTEAAIIDFAVLLQSGRTGENKENYFYPPYMFSGELLKKITFKDNKGKDQFLYYFMVDYINPETKKPFTICIKMFGFSSFNTTMKRATIGDVLTIKFLGLKENPKAKGEPFLSCFVSGYSKTETTKDEPETTKKK